MPTPTVLTWMPTNPFGYEKQSNVWEKAVPSNPFLLAKKANIWNKVLPVDRTIPILGQLYPRGNE